MKRVEFFASGEPKGQPRARAVMRGSRAGVFDPGTADGWKACVKLAACGAGLQNARMGGPLKLRLAFRFPRPASHFKGGDRSKALRLDAPRHKTGKPDLDNAAKAVMDALTDIGAWQDDALVADLRVTKVHDACAVGCLITLEELEDARA